MSIELIIGIVGVLGSLAATYIALRKQPQEILKLDAEATNLYAQAMEKAQASFMARIDNLEVRVTYLEEENELLKDWAERLVFQVKSLGAEPVKMKLKPVRISK